MLNDIGGGSKLTKIEALLNQTINEHFMLKHNDKTLAVPESDLNDLVNVRRELNGIIIRREKRTI